MGTKALHGAFPMEDTLYIFCNLLLRSLQNKGPLFIWFLFGALLLELAVPQTATEPAARLVQENLRCTIMCASAPALSLLLVSVVTGVRFVVLPL
jgi:hypothetical protein